MPKKLSLDRSFLKGKRLDVSSRTLERWRGGRAEEIERVVVDGTLLNIPESVIYHALTRLKINFVAQAVLGEGRALGGAMPDFILYDGYNIALEYNGPFHYSSEGQVKDFWRKVMHEAQGLTRIALEEKDITRRDGAYDIGTTIGTIRKLIGAPYTSSTGTVRS